MRWLFPLVAAMILYSGNTLAEDHSEFFDEPFQNGSSVTEACLGCHEDAAHEVMQTTHWTWSSRQSFPGSGGEVDRGKKNAMNNFCIAVPSNWPRCTSCHAGYGWKNANFDFSDESKVDCLVCHDHSGQYHKSPAGAGNPAPGVDLLAAARSVGRPTDENCGSCHFYGGGGDHVKHGDLDTSLLKGDRNIDVHMSPDGAGLSCIDCHTTESHVIHGTAMVVSPGGVNQVQCTDCHDEKPHGDKYLDQHVDRVACQTCHIPKYAKEMPTNMDWDWSEAGQDLPETKDEFGLVTYHKKKGRFRWEKNVTPTYAWYNGEGEAYQLGQTIDPDQTVLLNSPVGDRNDPKSKIHPFKVHTGRQIYDAKNKVMIVPKLYGKDGYWKTFDWDKSARLGMKTVGLDYSGEYGFVATKMYWRVNHMVAPKEQALQCTDCHGHRGHQLDWVALGYGEDPIVLMRKARKAQQQEETN